MTDSRKQDDKHVVGPFQGVRLGFRDQDFIVISEDIQDDAGVGIQSRYP